MGMMYQVSMIASRTLCVTIEHQKSRITKYFYYDYYTVCSVQYFEYEKGRQAS